MLLKINENKPNEMLELMSNIEYGYMNHNKQKIKTISEESFYTDYRLQSPDELLESRIGVCWDQCELERYYFDKYSTISFKIYYIEARNKNRASHTLLIYKYKQKYFWFENSWFQYRGIHEFNNMDEIFEEVSKKHLKHANSECEEKTNEINWFILDKPNYGIGCDDFMIHATKNDPIYKFVG